MAWRWSRVWPALALAVAAHAADPVDINTADVDTLAALPGLGPDKAQAIVAWRAAHGDFAAVSELSRIPGIGRATVQTLGARLEVERDLPPSAQPGPVDINRADAAGLAELPGVDSRLADRIVADRNQLGPYGSCNELVRVDGIGVATLAVLGPSCTASR